MRRTAHAHAAVAAALMPGDAALDGTAGNGRDTLALARLVGPAGRVFAVDVQPEAVARTRLLLAEARVTNVTLIEADHARLAELVPAEFHGRLGAAMFNLGNLPGSGRAVATTTPTTLVALAAAWGLLRPGGLLSVVAYRGHPGGAAECLAVEALLFDLAGEGVQTAEGWNATSPKLFLAARRP